MLIPSRAWGFLRSGLNGRYGVRMADAPVGGDHPSLIGYPGVWTEPQDAATEVVFVPETLPLQGTLTVYANGSYIHGPITGSDPWTVRVYYVVPGADAQEATGSPATITDSGGAAVGVAVESDTALPLQGRQIGPIGRADESDIALPLLAGASGKVADPLAVWEGFALEAGLTPGAMLRIVVAAVAGRTEGIGTNTERYFSVDGSKPRITATFDAQGNRTTIVLDGSP